MERLLEESHEHGAGALNLYPRAGTSASFRNKSDEMMLAELEKFFVGTEKDGGSFRSGRGGRFPGRGRERRSASDGHPSLPVQSNPFLQSAREIKNHLRNLGTHNSLDISGMVDRQSEGVDRTHSQLQGFFRQRDESPSDTNPLSVSVNR